MQVETQLLEKDSHCSHFNKDRIYALRMGATKIPTPQLIKTDLCHKCKLEKDVQIKDLNEEGIYAPHMSETRIASSDLTKRGLCDECTIEKEGRRREFNEEGACVKQRQLPKFNKARVQRKTGSLGYYVNIGRQKRMRNLTSMTKITHTRNALV